jgi:3-hydroxybutyrate dehydrogenase
MGIANKVAVVTGAASGIGREIAKLFLANGAKVAIADIKGADEAARELDPTGKTTLGITMDVASESAVDSGIDQVAKHFGSVDILVSNAGIQIVEPVDQFDFAQWKRMLAIHLDGAFLTTRASLRHMYKQGRGGAIIYMGSVHSKEASPLKAPYVTAKHGLMGLCRVVAKEGAAHGVRANVICPGYVWTPLVEKQIPETAQARGISEEEVVKKVMLGNTVDGEFTTLADVAAATLFFASFDTNALTGQSLVVSHGWHME